MVALRPLSFSLAVLQNDMPESFVSCFIEARGPDYDRTQLLWTLRTLISAGMETTATFIRWAIVLLTNHVPVQDRLHADIDVVVGRRRVPSLDDRSELVDDNTFFIPARFRRQFGVARG